MQPSLPTWVSILALAIGPAVGGAIALVGALGGPWLKARTDQQQWHREKRLDAYAELARTIHDLTEAISRRRDAVEPEMDGAQQGVDKALYEVMRAAGRVELLGPPDVRNASIRLARFVTDATGSLRHYSPAQPQQLVVITDQLNTLYNVFMDATRQDLGVR